MVKIKLMSSVLTKIEERLRLTCEIIPKIPPKINSKIIGHTINDRSIMAYSLSNGSYTILYLAGIHGDEIAPVKTMLKWINWLYKHKTLIPKNLRVIVIPCLNIDGYTETLKHKQLTYNHNHKTNTNNIDLNCNWPTNKYKYGIEPETYNLSNFILEQNIKIIFSFHGNLSRIWSTGDFHAKKLAQRFAEQTPYTLINPSHHDQPEPDPRQQPGHILTWATEQGLSLIEIDGKFKWAHEWSLQRKALITSLNLASLAYDTVPADIKNINNWVPNPAIYSEMD